MRVPRSPTRRPKARRACRRTTSLWPNLKVQPAGYRTVAATEVVRAGVLATSWGSGFVIYDIIQAESNLAAHAVRESLSTKEAAFVALEPREGKVGFGICPKESSSGSTPRQATGLSPLMLAESTCLCAPRT